MTDTIGPNRLRALEGMLRGGEGECPFVIAAGKTAAHDITLKHYSGGRYADYVFVSRPGVYSASPAMLAVLRPGAQVTIRYAPHVAGTTIIYDATAQTMQGKARPFTCDLSVQALRAYALLPYQIESTRLVATKELGKIRFQVAFLDACGEKIQAALPFQLRLIGPNRREPVCKDTATDRQGEYDSAPDYVWPASGQRWQAVVRSLLTGNEESAEFTTP